MRFRRRPSSPSAGTILLLACVLGCRSDVKRPVADAAPATRASAAAPVRAAESEQLTIGRLRRLVAAVSDPDSDDERRLALIAETSRGLSPADLPVVERFAQSEGGRPAAFLMARLLVEHRQFDAAAGVIVTGALDRPSENREYAIWKWWHYNFRERTDFKEISDRIGDALLRQFDVGGPERRRAVADLFGLGAAGAKLSPAEFRKAVEMGPPDEAK